MQSRQQAAFEAERDRWRANGQAEYVAELPDALREQLGMPIGVNRIQDGEVWTYRGGWAVVVRNGMVTEAWISRPPES